MVISSRGEGGLALTPCRLLPVVQCFFSACNIEKNEMSLGTRLGIAYWDQRIRVIISVCVGGDPNGPWSTDLAYDSILDLWIQNGPYNEL
jgi:hypothetical protein